jgi:uncharacterized membrane protein YkoI
MAERRSWLLALVTASMLLAASTFESAAGQERKADHERARAARDRGESVPLANILTAVERDFHGRVIDVEFEREDGKLVYELELLVPDGRVAKLTIDARSGELVKLEGVRLETIMKQRTREGAPKP